MYTVVLICCFYASECFFKWVCHVYYVCDEWVDLPFKVHCHGCRKSTYRTLKKIITCMHYTCTRVCVNRDSISYTHCVYGFGEKCDWSSLSVTLFSGDFSLMIIGWWLTRFKGLQSHPRNVKYLFKEFNYILCRSFLNVHFLLQFPP